jgi:alkylation response protein AidB-like acyl-CoA dehydrogenase
MTDHQDLHHELRSVARDLLAKDNVDWQLLVQAGWVGLEAPEQCGGAGASFAEVAVVLDEIGRAAASTAYLGGAVLSVFALNMLQPNNSRDQMLNDVVAGKIRAAVALPTDGSTAPRFRFDGATVTGRVEFVPDAGVADDLLLLAASPSDQPVIVRVPTAALDVQRQSVLDETRGLATVSADAVAVDDAAVWAIRTEAAAALLDRARLAVACDSLGLAEAMLDATVSYAGLREQFGRPIGSFQAVKHACADMLVSVTVGRRLVADAVEAVAAGAPEATTAVLMAKAHTCGSAVDVVGKAMQLHGGIGYTWESGIHVYLKRAALNRSLFGSPAAHRKQLAERYENWRN